LLADFGRGSGRQLTALTRGALALGLGVVETANLVRRVALDSIPAARRAVLAALADPAADQSMTVVAARAAGLDRGVARRALEELAAVGVVACERIDDEPEEEERDTRPASGRCAGATAS
jgi:hypothetical protein